MNLYDDLQSRGIIQQVTDPELKTHLAKPPVGVYVGFDPTSDSLHVGNLLALITLRRFQLAGHRPIAVVGGATGMIGDPSGKSQERQLLTSESIRKNVEGITRIISRFLDFKGTHPATVVNNLDWFEKFSFVDFLRDVGKHFTVNYMTAKESVRARLEDREHGISYTEFSYMLLQGYDFHILNRERNCTLQIGGSDQWGNITAGTELIRRMGAAEGKPGAQAYGLVWPLLTKSDGSKFGKTESGAVWLSADRTSPYHFYQFFIQTPDADAMKLLKLFSLKTLAELDEIEARFKAKPEERLAQLTLARELTTLVHGEEECKRVETSSKALFDTSISQLGAEQILELLSESPRSTLKKDRIAAGIGLVELLVETGLSGSNGAARKDITGGGIYVNNERVSDAGLKLGSAQLIGSKCLVLRKGKKNYHLVVFE